MRIAKEAAPIVVSARSAVFAPVLGVICGLRSTTPRTSRRPTRATTHAPSPRSGGARRAVAIFSTRDAEAGEAGNRLERLELGGRLAGSLPPRSHRRPAPGGRLSALGTAPRAQARRALEPQKGGKAILLLNRRGVAPAVRTAVPAGCAAVPTVTSRSSFTPTGGSTATTAPSSRRWARPALHAARLSLLASGPDSGSSRSSRRRCPASSEFGSMPMLFAARRS